MTKYWILAAAVLYAGDLVLAQRLDPQSNLERPERMTVAGTVDVKTDDKGNVVHVAIVPASGDAVLVLANAKSKLLAQMKGKTIKAEGLRVKDGLFVWTFEEVKPESAPAATEKTE